MTAAILNVIICEDVSMGGLLDHIVLTASDSSLCVGPVAVSLSIVGMRAHVYTFLHLHLLLCVCLW